MFQNAKELYDAMCDTPNLCGTFELKDDMIHWNLFEGYTIQIAVDPRGNYFHIEKKLVGKLTDPLTHWHPEADEIYEDVCSIGLKGNVLVIRKNLLCTSVLYMGKEEGCPYSSKTKWCWGKILYLKAK